jgi:PEGA domain
MTLRIALAVAIAGFVAMGRALAAGHGSVYVATLPPGATVWMDGRYMGETPLFIDGLSGGRHVVLLTRAGWQPLTTAADVTVGHVTSMSAVLNQNSGSRAPAVAAKGFLRIRDAQGAKVFVDGIALTSLDDPVTLLAGEHILAVERGAAKSASSFQVYPDTTTTVSLAPQQTTDAAPASANEDELAALEDYVPANDFVVNGDDITVHFRGNELECAAGSLTYTLNGKSGMLSVAPEMVGSKPYLPVSLLNRLAGTH